jgi:hypothetical protein
MSVSFYLTNFVRVNEIETETEFENFQHRTCLIKSEFLFESHQQQQTPTSWPKSVINFLKAEISYNEFHQCNELKNCSKLVLFINSVNQVIIINFRGCYDSVVDCLNENLRVPGSFPSRSKLSWSRYHCPNGLAYWVLTCIPHLNLCLAFTLRANIIKLFTAVFYRCS